MLSKSKASSKANLIIELRVRAFLNGIHMNMERMMFRFVMIYCLVETVE
jgi:hypothetical protein